MASSQSQLLQLVPLLLLLLLVVTCSHAKSCKCPERRHGPRMEDYNFSTSSLNALNTTYPLVLNKSGLFFDVTRHELLDVPDDAPALVYVPHEDRAVNLVSGEYDSNKGSYHFSAEASFTVSFTMSIFRPSRIQAAAVATPSTNSTSLAFIVLSHWSELAWDTNLSLTKQLSLGADGSLVLSDAIHRSADEVSVKIGRVPFLSHQPFFPGNRVLGVDITITEAAASSANYTVWIEYDRLQHIFSVYVAAGEGKMKPASAIASVGNVSFADEAYLFAKFGIFSTVGQLLEVHTWNFWIEGLPDIYAAFRMKLIMLELILPICASILVVAGVCVAWYLRSEQRRWKKEQEKLAKTMRRLPGVPTQVDFADIRKATANFHETMKLGKGGFSSVYRCRLPSLAAAAAATSSSSSDQHHDVAVKKFTREVEEQRYEDFLAEVSIINRLRHKNIVPLVGWSYNKGEPILIYDYMLNGSLDQHLFRRASAGQQQRQQDDASIRQWHTRYSIARDIATGLHYVHHEHEPMVLHRDIKASNIMLDSNLHARLGDFGIACTVAADRSSVTGVAGTWGYIAPDYAMSNRATRQTDIYAFGVLMLEVVTGRKNRDVPADDGHISDWVWRLHGEEKLLEAVDGHLEGVVVEEAERLLLFGLACTNPNPSSRPSMAEAVQVITKLAPPPDVPPKRPAFVWPPKEWRSLDSDYSTNDESSSLGLVELMQQIVHDQPAPQTQSTMFFSA